MAIQWPKTQQDDYLMSKSVMDEPRPPYRQLLDAIMGRTLPEQATSAFSGLMPLSANIAKRALPGAGKHAFNIRQLMPISDSTLSLKLDPGLANVTEDMVKSFLPGYQMSIQKMRPSFFDAPGTHIFHIDFWDELGRLSPKEMNRALDMLKTMGVQLNRGGY